MDMKDKISKLLAKAEGTDNEHERETFTAAAERLMLKLGIDAAELQAAGTVKAEDIVELHRVYRGGYAIVMVPFAHGVATAFGDLQTLQATNRSGKLFYVIGHKSDVETYFQLLDSLEAQAMSAMHAWKKANPGPRDQSRYIAARSFLSGFGSEVSRRLRETKKATLQETDITPGAELVLASKMDRVTGWRDDKYPTLGKSRGGAKNGDYAAASAGRTAGARANLGSKALGQQGKLTS